MDQQAHKLAHHSLLDGDFDVFRQVSTHLCAYTAIVTPENAEQEISAAIRIAKQKRKPVYLMVAMDLVTKPIVQRFVPEVKKVMTYKPALEAAIQHIHGLLKGTNLTKSFDTPFGSELILSGVNLNLEEGSIIALIGESGGGKTTLCRILMGLDTADSGNVFLLGKEVGRLRMRSFAECASIQYVFQDPYASMADEARVISTLSEPARLCKRNHRDYLEPEEALVLAGLSGEEFLERKIKSLSGGQRQKIAIARALITRPQIIIADESTSMLDESSAQEMSSIFRRVNKLLGVSFLIVTHNKHTLFDLCTFILVLHQGKIVEAGPKEEVLTSPQAEYTRQYLECMLNIEGRTDFEQNNVHRSYG